MRPSSLCWQAVFFDFDGVICASLKVKIRAFATLFAPYGPAVQQAVIRYHRENGGMPRHRKIRHCFETFVGRAVDDREVEAAVAAFAGLVEDQVVAAPLIAGALESLQLLKAASIPAFVVSGTPEEEMRRIVAGKGMEPLFAGVYGSPRTKSEILTDLLTRYALGPDQCLFIGDALADYRAAKAAGLHFLGIVPDNHPSLFPDHTPISPRVVLRL